MPSEQTNRSDLRSTAQDSKRDAARKHKWALGKVEPVGRAQGNPRPFRPSETRFNMKRRETKGAVASMARGVKVARKRDMLENTSDSEICDECWSGPNSSSDGDEASPSLPADAGVMYSFDAPHGPTSGSQILNATLAKAVKNFEEKETDKIVKDEYDIIDSEGESIGLSPVKKKGKERAIERSVPVPDPDEEDYEFV